MNEPEVVADADAFSMVVLYIQNLVISLKNFAKTQAGLFGTNSVTTASFHATRYLIEKSKQFC